MNDKINFSVPYGILQKNIFGKYTNKVKNIINVNTIIIFSDDYIHIDVYDIDRNDGKGIHNEEYCFYYESLIKIEILEDVSAFNIIEKEDEESSLFLINRKDFEWFDKVFKKLKEKNIFE